MEKSDFDVLVRHDLKRLIENLSLIKTTISTSASVKDSVGLFFKNIKEASKKLFNAVVAREGAKVGIEYAGRVEELKEYKNNLRDLADLADGMRVGAEEVIKKRLDDKYRREIIRNDLPQLRDFLRSMLIRSRELKIPCDDLAARFEILVSEERRTA